MNDFFCRSCLFNLTSLCIYSDRFLPVNNFQVAVLDNPITKRFEHSYLIWLDGSVGHYVPVKWKKVKKGK